MTTLKRRVTYLIDDVAVYTFDVALDDEDASRAITLTILKELREMSATITAALADLEAKVTAESDVEQSVITLLGGLSQMIKDLRAQIANMPPSAEVTAAIEKADALTAQVEARSAALAAAAVANTPAG